MNSADQQLLLALCQTASSFFDRGFAFGSTGNLSVRLSDGRIGVTPTGLPLKGLSPDSLALLDPLTGQPLGAPQPSKESPFHLAIYRRRPDVHAIVHLHSTYATALSCLATIDSQQPLPAITPYYFMRVAPLAIVDYFRPGSAELAAAIEQAALTHHNLLLRNHGLITTGANWNEAVDRAEELEETAKLAFLLRGESLRRLTAAEIADLYRAFPPKDPLSI